MADDDPGGGSGNKISAFLGHKSLGPVPNAVWVFGGIAVVFYLYKRNAAAKAGTAASGTPGQFSSSTTTTDPTTGNTTTYQANGPSTGFLDTGGQLVTTAGAMPYSGGDVYVNYPAQSTAPTQPPSGPKYPPQHASPAPTGATGSWWYTLPAPTDPSNLANTVYQLGNDPNHPSPGAVQIMAADLVNIMAANPQINWSQLTANPGNKIPAGTAIYVPLAGGIAGQMAKPPANASLNAPPSYSPPNQTTSMVATA